MAEAFLSQLLRVENCIQDGDGQCGICLQDYDSLRDDGTIERQIRLPCNHTVGWECIAIWLSANNSCPFCRREFFSAQPREHEIMDDDTDYDDDDDEESDEDNTDDVYPGEAFPDDDADDDEENNEENTDENFSGLDTGELLTELSTYRFSFNSMITPYHFSFDPMVMLIFRQIVKKVEVWDPPTPLSQMETIAFSIYIGSHIAGQPKSLRQLSFILRVSEDTLCSYYTNIYPDRQQFFDSEMLEVIGRGDLETVLRFLPPTASPNPQDGENEDNERFIAALTSIKNMCETYSLRLCLSSEAFDIVQRFTANFYISCLRSGHAPETIAAVLVWAASEFTGERKAFSTVSSMSGVSVRTIKDLWSSVYPDCARLVEEEGASLSLSNRRAREG